MSTGDITLTLEKRKVVGKQVRALRREGKVPAVIHNHGKESVVVDAPFIEITKTYEKAGKHHPVDLKVGDEKYLAIIKDVDLDPRKNTLRHVVFNAVRQNEKVKAEVPVHFEGDSAAEKAGLMLLPQLEVVEVEATPRNLPDAIVVDVSNLAEIGDKIHVSDLKAPDGVVIVAEPEQSVISVIETPAQQSEEAEAEEATEPEDGAPDVADSAESKSED